jgi:amidase
MVTFLEDYDLLLTATPARPPLKLGEMEMISDDGERSVACLFDEVSPLTSVFNQTGGAAMRVPLTWTSDGLPIGSAGVDSVMNPHGFGSQLSANTRSLGRIVGRRA